MDWTDRDCRYFHRLLTPNARLYTEMVVAHAVIRGDRPRLLGFDASEHPLALQLGGSDPQLLAQASLIAHDFGYDEINLNCGCPSDRVQAGRFGACLMLEPNLVADCLSAMRSAISASIPVTVKCRLGVDAHDSFEQFLNFVDVLSAAGTTVFIVHARKAWLSGLSPKENREKPPLWYDRVHQLKALRPKLTIVLNGGLDTVSKSMSAMADATAPLDGVMIGRAAYHQSWLLAELEREMFGTQLPNRTEIVEALQHYLNARAELGLRARQLGRHLMGFFHSEPGTKAWRQALSAGAEPEQAWKAALQMTASSL